MQKIISRLSYLLVLVSLVGTHVYAQKVEPLTTEASEFIKELDNKTAKSRIRRAQELMPAFSELWAAGQLTPNEQAMFIQHINMLMSKRGALGPETGRYMAVVLQMKQEDVPVNIPLGDFFKVSEEVVPLGMDRLNIYLQNFYNYISTGDFVSRKRYSWEPSDTSPSLIMLEKQYQGKTFKAPVVEFSETDITYGSVRDTSIIYNTSGTYNLISMKFSGKGGKVDWSKVGLDPSDVYCELNSYQLNVNYGLIEADSVGFYYNSLLSKSLIGRFEDKNTGYRDTAKANYPYFKSYEGGVVIDNLIPNVRYEGGFSLKGIRRLGTSYDTGNQSAPMPEAPEDNGLYAVEIDIKNAQIGEEEAWGAESNYASESEDIYEGGFEGGFEGGYDDGYNNFQHVEAKMEILRAGEIAMKLQGEAFLLDIENLKGDHLEATLYADEDSLFHPDMDLIYRGETQTVILKKPRKGAYASTPFASSFHEYYFYFESIRWNLDTDELHFTAFIDKENKTSRIESFDFFNQERFSGYKNVMRVNPIGAIYRYALKNGYNAQTARVSEEEAAPIITVENILEDYNQSNFRIQNQEASFKRALPVLRGAGFIEVDKNTKEITPLPKLFTWGRAARGKKDFDALLITSKVNTGSHAIMDMQSKEIKMRGVPYFRLTDAQPVKVIPDSGQVNVLKNRDLNFNGIVEAGKINFYGSDSTGTRNKFSFDYSGFSIRCDSIDSMKFVVGRHAPKGSELSRLEKALSNTIFEGITGMVHIDDPNNKSGQKDYEHYPVFDSYSSSYLYWANPKIQGGVYTKDKMNFSVLPFVLDSLDLFTNDGLRFDGEFNSSEIFPKFPQTLAVMDDGTLGFIQETPEDGYRVYEGKGRFYDEIVLDGSGLHGSGRLEHMNTVIESDSFIFHFDSVMAFVDSFSMERSYRYGSVPDVKAQSSEYVWYTKENSLKLRSKDQPIAIFEGKGQFEGTLTLSEKGMIGSGSLLLGQVEITGDSLVFSDREVDAENSQFAIVDENDIKLYHFVAENVSINFDTYRDETKFESKNAVPTPAIFPIHKYRTSLTAGEYNPEEKVLELSGVSSYKQDNYFQAIDPGRTDSLTFTANASRYEVETRSIEVSGVPYIYVADALITPDKMEVTINETGIIKKLENAVVVIDKPNGGKQGKVDSIYHKIYDAVVDIYGADEYEGSGTYDYIEVNGKKQAILFDDIEVSSDTITLAKGTIAEEDEFYLTDRIFFKGNVELDASEKFLKFEGEVRVESENPVFKGSWFTFNKTVVNPDSVYIPIPETIRNDRGDLLTVGLNFVPDERFFYSNFLQAKTDDDDLEVVSASGGLTLDRKTQEFKIGSQAKITGKTFKGATVSFDDKKNTITSKGYLNFPYDFKENTLKMEMAGSWKESIEDGNVSTDLLVGLDIGSLIPDAQLEKLADNFLYLTTNNKDIDFNQNSFLADISELLDKGKGDSDKETRKFLKSVNNAMVYTDIKLSSLLPYTFLMSNVNFHYNEEERAMYCDSLVGLIGINQKPINKMIKAKVVYQFGDVSPSGEKTPDEVTLYMEIDDVNWIYFHISGDVVKTAASYYDDYNYQLQDYLDKQKGTPEGFHLELSNEDEVNEFKQTFIQRFMRK